MNTNNSKMPVLPSDFLKLGFPSCSILRDAWSEMTAVTYLEALVAEGDKWQTLHSILFDHARLEFVASKLTNADDARYFALAWDRPTQ